LNIDTEGGDFSTTGSFAAQEASINNKIKYLI